MTLNQLLSETYALGFEDSGTLDESFVFAANRAVRLIAGEHGYRKRARFYVPPPDISYHAEALSGSRSKTLSFSAEGVAYSFRAYGSGTFFIKDGSLTRAFTFGDDGSPYSGTIKSGKAEFTVFSSSAFTLLDFTVFASVFSEDNIPIYDARPTYDLGQRISDFSYAAGPPTDVSGAAIAGAVISGDELTLPRGFCGEVYIYYKPIPKALTVDDGESQIDIPKKCLHLCPILTAAYIWLDDDEEKAAYYMQIYKDESQKIRLQTPKVIDADYRDVTGWAK